MPKDQDTQTTRKALSIFKEKYVLL